VWPPGVVVGEELVAEEFAARQGCAAARRTKITSFDPSLPAIIASYPAPPLHPWTTLSHPPLELPSSKPGSRLHLDRRVYFAAVSFAVLTRIQGHRTLEHVPDSEWKRATSKRPATSFALSSESVARRFRHLSRCLRFDALSYPLSNQRADHCVGLAECHRLERRLVLRTGVTGGV
jgi:hypothetical protein